MHIRTVIRDGVVHEQRRTERMLLNQDGDEPPEELQRAIDRMAEDFRNYDITPPET